jgi:hypothetical protein
MLIAEANFVGKEAAMVTWKRWVTLLTLVSLGGLAWGGQHPDVSHRPPPSPAFQAVQQLAGTWVGTATEATGKVMPVTVVYRLTSAGSAVEERLMVGTPEEMVDMYYDEDGALKMTHYCALGNRPRMAAHEASAERIVLEMGPSPGIDPARDLHMHSLTLEFPARNRLIQRWTSYRDGKPAGVTVFALNRERAE